MSMQTVTLTQTTYSVAPVAHAVQNDTGRKLLMILGDVTVASGWTAELAFKRPNNTYYSVQATIDTSNNGFRATLTQALTQAGTVRAQLKVTSTDGIVSTYTFIIEVQPDAKGVATPEASYTLEEAYRLAEQSQDIAEEATAAAAAALDDIENLAPAIKIQEELVQTNDGVTLTKAAAERGFNELKFFLSEMRTGSGHATPTNKRYIQELDSVTLNLNGTTKTYSPRVSSQGSTNVRPVPPCSFDFVRKYFISSVHFAYLLANYDPSNISGSVDAGTGLFVAHIKIETSYEPDGNHFLSPIMEYKARGTLGEYEYSYEGYTAASGSAPAYITFAVSVPGVTTVAEFNSWAGEVVQADAASARVYFTTTDRQTVTIEDPHFTTVLGDNTLSATCTLRNAGSASTQTQKPGRFVVKYTKDTTLYTSEIEENVTRNTGDISEIGDDVQDIQNTLGMTVDELKTEKRLNVAWESGGVMLDGAWAGQRVNDTKTIRMKTASQLTQGSYIITSHGQQMTAFGYSSATVHDRTTYTGERSERWTHGTVVVTVPEGEYVLVATRIDGVTDFTPSENELEIFAYDQTLENALQIEALKDDESESLPPAHNPNLFFIAHQGYTSESGTNNDRLLGYKKAADLGFDYGETDIRQSSDGVLVCTHDPSFTDATTGNTIVVADHTLAELQTYDYYGTTIATFEDIVKSCKMNGIGIVVDQINLEDIDPALTILKKYHMLEHAIFLVSPLGTGIIAALKAAYPKLRLMMSNSTATASDWVTYVNNVTDGVCEVYVDLWASNFTPEQVAALSAQFPTGTKIVIFGGSTLDTPENVPAYAQYADGIMSNKVCFNDIKRAGLL